jgi:hypothetical protein
VIIIRNKKLLLTLSVFFIAFLFTGCFLFNSSPIIESDPVTTAKEGAEYTYDVEATDPNGDTLTYSLTVNPTGMTINSTIGVINWTPIESQIGENEVVVEVSDGSRSTIQEFTIIVDEAKLASIEVLPSSMTVEVGKTKAITSVTAYYDNNTNANIALNACNYESNKSNATVSSNGIITGVSSCSASTPVTITVSYTEDSITKTDTISVIVSAPPTGGG